MACRLDEDVSRDLLPLKSPYNSPTDGLVFPGVLGNIVSDTARPRLSTPRGRYILT